MRGYQSSFTSATLSAVTIEREKPAAPDDSGDCSETARATINAMPSANTGKTDSSAR
jgi:hypothetical protein